MATSSCDRLGKWRASVAGSICQRAIYPCSNSIIYVYIRLLYITVPTNRRIYGQTHTDKLRNVYNNNNNNNNNNHINNKKADRQNPISNGEKTKKDKLAIKQNDVPHGDYISQKMAARLL